MRNNTQEVTNTESADCDDFSLIAAKAIVETAENFLNERLTALSNMHRRDGPSRQVEVVDSDNVFGSDETEFSQFNRQLYQLHSNQIEKVMQSLRSNLAVNPAYYSILNLKRESRLLQNSNESTKQKYSQEQVDVEGFIDRFLDSYICTQQQKKAKPQGTDLDVNNKEEPDQEKEIQFCQHFNITFMTVLLLERLHLNDLRLQQVNKKLNSSSASVQDKDKIHKMDETKKATLKNIQRTISKLDKQIQKNISVIQLKYDMMQFESEIEEVGSRSLKNLSPDFNQYIITYIMNHFATKIPTHLTRIFQELNLSEQLIKDLQKNKRQRKSSAKKQVSLGTASYAATASPQEINKTPQKNDNLQLDDTAPLNSSASKKTDAKQTKAIAVTSNSKSPKANSKRKQSPKKMEQVESLQKLMSPNQTDKDKEKKVTQTPEKQIKNEVDNKNQESSSKKNLLQKRILNQPVECNDQQSKKLREQKENVFSDVQKQLFPHTSFKEHSKPLSHFIQVVKDKNAKRSFLEPNQNLLNAKGTYAVANDTSCLPDTKKDVVGKHADVEPRSKSVTNVQPQQSTANQGAIPACFQNSTSLKKTVPMRRFKAQDIKTSKPKLKQNFICQQTQFIYNLYSLSAKQEMEKKASKTSVASGLTKKHSNGAQESTKRLEGGSKNIVLSNSLLIEGSSKIRQGSVLSRLKSRATQKPTESAIATQTNSNQQQSDVGQTQSSSNDKSSLGKFTNSGGGEQCTQKQTGLQKQGEENGHNAQQLNVCSHAVFSE